MAINPPKLPSKVNYRKAFEVPARQAARFQDGLATPKKLAVPQNYALNDAPALTFGQKFKLGMGEFKENAPGAINSIAPYASNIINAFRRPPRPAVPKLASPVSMARVNYGADRAEINRTIEGQNLATRGLSENSAAAVRTANMVEGMRATGQSYQNEANQNASLNNTEIALNARIDQNNVTAQNQYQDDVVNAQMAEQQQRAANLANASDKYIGIQNEQRRAELDGQKYGILAEIYKPDGVLQRFTAGQTPDQYGVPNFGVRRYGGKLRYAAGGMLQKVYGPGTPVQPPTRYLVPGQRPSGMVPQALSLEADRSPDAMALSPQGQALAYQKAMTDFGRNEYIQQGSPVRPMMGTTNPQTGDFIPNTQYSAPGRVNMYPTTAGTAAASQQVVQTAKSRGMKFKKGGTLKKC